MAEEAHRKYVEIMRDIEHMIDDHSELKHQVYSKYLADPFP
jgi:hypothetical protein